MFPLGVLLILRDIKEFIKASLIVIIGSEFINIYQDNQYCVKPLRQSGGSYKHWAIPFNKHTPPTDDICLGG